MEVFLDSATARVIFENGAISLNAVPTNQHTHKTVSISEAMILGAGGTHTAHTLIRKFETRIDRWTRHTALSIAGILTRDERQIRLHRRLFLPPINLTTTKHTHTTRCTSAAASLRTNRTKPNRASSDRKDCTVLL